MKSDKWYAAMHARKGKGTNQFTKAKELGHDPPDAWNKGKEGTFKGRSHTEETKNKIRDKRLKFLEENPDKVPYKLNHYSKGKSYAEQYWKIILESHNIEFIEEYPIGLYSLDFAIVDKKVDLEIDGDQHHLDKRIVESDKRRDSYLECNGWSVIRIKWSDYKKICNKKDYINEIIEKIK